MGNNKRINKAGNKKMRIQIDHKSNLPLHIQVETLIRTLIGEEEYQNGKLLPCEVDLANMLGISRNTVRQAFNKLVHEGMLVRRKGLGTKVAEKNILTSLNNWSYTGEMLRKGVDTKDYLVETSEISADKEVAQALSVAEGTKVVMIKRIRGTNKKPIVCFVSYFHPRIGVKLDSDFSKPVCKLLEEDFSIFVSLSKEEIRAIPADNIIAENLQVEIGSPILFRKRKIFDPGERIVEYNLGFYRADSFVYTIDITRGK
jgi:GntR family transcriptional regulator